MQQQRIKNHNTNSKHHQNKKPNMKKDFKQFFIEQAGSSSIKDGQFQQVEEIENQQNTINNNQQNPSDNQFEQVDDEQQVNVGGIKAAQFWSGIKMPTYSIPVSKQAVNFNIRCAMSAGFNSLGRDNIFYLDGKICKAVGCVLIYDEHIYPKHSQKITTISYNKNTQQILTATEGPNPQLFLWKYDSQQQTIQWKKKFFLGKKSQDIYAISFFKQTFIIAVQRFTLHKASTLHVFDKLIGKRLSTLKVGKFYDLQLLQRQQQQDKSNGSNEQYQDENQSQQSQSQLEQVSSHEQRLFFANDEGISQIIISSPTQQQPIPIISAQQLQQSTTITCLCPFNSPNNGQQNVEILTGDRQGNIKATFSSHQIKAHNGWIFQIKHQIINSIDYFFSLGAIDSHLAVISYSSQKQFNILHQIQLNGYGRSIEYNQDDDLLLVGERDGCCEQFHIEQLVSSSIQTQSIANITTLSLKCFQSKIKNKQFIINLPNKDQLNQGKKVYAYGHSASRNLRLFAVENSQQVLFKNIKEYPLRSYPQTLDISNNLLAYTYDVEYKQQEAMKSQSFSTMFHKKSSNKKQKPFEKSILVIQDFQSKQLITKIEIKLEQGQKQKCTAIKFSPSGRYLAMGDIQGRVFIYEINNQNNKKQWNLSQQEAKFILPTDKAHKQGIVSIVWSKNQRYFKTTSSSQLYYWSVSKDPISTSTTTPSIILKSEKPMSLRDTYWVALSKYSWQTKSVWQGTSLIDQLDKFWLLQYVSTQQVNNSTTQQIASQKRQLILSCSIDGTLRVYNCPANSSKYQSIKLNNQPFQLIQYLNDSDSYSFLVIIQGAIMVIQLSVDQQQ